MNNHELKVYSKDIQVGMYVTQIDRPWLESPFLLQGFMINDEDDKALLIKHCGYCYIDIHRSKIIKPIYQRTTQEDVSFRSKKDGAMNFKRPRILDDQSKTDEEIDRVRGAHKKMTTAVKDMMRALTLSKKFNLEETRTAIKPMVDSILRNPDAVIWLNRLRELDDYSYSHAMGCSIWAMSLGRQLSLPRLDIESLGLGGLFLDVGKTKIPKKILSKLDVLTEEDTLTIKQHVQFSMDIINTDKGVNDKIKGMVQYHHERVNGNGYPHQLTGEHIPLFAKIAAIVDCYDAITSNRNYAKAISSQEAVKKLYEWRGKDFQSELVEEFIQSIGLYPSGTLVELSTGEVAVVVTGSRTRRLRPKIMMILNADKSMREDYVMCNLMHTPKDEKGKPYDIVHALPVGSYGIRPDEYYL